VAYCQVFGVFVILKAQPIGMVVSQGHALEMITQGNGWYLQLWASVDVLEMNETACIVKVI